MIDYTNASLPTTPLSWDGAVAIDVKVEASDFWVWFDSMADKVVFEVRILFFKKRVYWSDLEFLFTKIFGER